MFFFNAILDTGAVNLKNVLVIVGPHINHTLSCLFLVGMPQSKGRAFMLKVLNAKRPVQFRINADPFLPQVSER